MKCPTRKKTCTPKAFKEFECGSWFCVGITTRKCPRGSKMDVIKLCIDGYYHKGANLMQLTPDEAAQIGGMFSIVAADWMNEFPEYQGFIDDNDK
jgi:hypothetical protein